MSINQSKIILEYDQIRIYEIQVKTGKTRRHSQSSLCLPFFGTFRTFISQQEISRQFSDDEACRSNWIPPNDKINVNNFLSKLSFR